METCRTCKNNIRGRCKVLDEMLLVRAISKKDQKEIIIRSMAILKDVSLDKFRCNFYEAISK